ncbi:sulfite exporter TauE/SafE family protein [Effusibacillus lacus]|nr:sulfite exporter TauE/SafE family protein [Effusibacillus lacus]TCS71436.1 ABC-type nickel/cobalt efflux system permease component RcnA [Effusibacillus lacus]
MELIYTIPAAVGLGALHSLEPGHGKGVLTAYLISSRARTRDAILLGIISAIAHTLSIVLLAFAASSTVKIFVQDQMVAWMQLISGSVICLMGGRILLQQVRPRVVVVGKIGHHLDDDTQFHQETCTHHHHHAHHGRETPSSLARLFSIGFFTGLIPCPSALAVLLAAISANQIPMGLGLVAAFSIGSAIAMSTLGMVVVRAEDSVRQLEKWRVANALTFVSSILILCLGGFVFYHALTGLGLS